jgi:alanine-synthesizing transaminase
MAWENENTLAKLYREKRRALREGRDLIDLSMVNPDLPPPRLLQDRLIEATNQRGSHRYSSSRGVRKLREAFAERYKLVFNVELDYESDCCVTLGAKDAVLHALAWFRQKSPVVLVGEPVYPAYRFAAQYLGMTVESFRVDQDLNQAMESLEQLARLNRGATLLINFPGNPFCKSASPELFDIIADIAEKYDLRLVNDFVYGEMLYSGEQGLSMLSNPRLKSRGVETYSLSKSFSVPGWRIGALLGSSEVVSGVSKLKSRVDFGGFLPLQFAGAAALQSDRSVVKELVDVYHRRHRLFSKLLLQTGWEVFASEGGCCVWAKCPDQLVDQPELALSLLSNGVAALPGQAFGRHYQGFMRFALVSDDAVLREAANRVVQTVESLTARSRSVSSSTVSVSS